MVKKRGLGKPLNALLSYTSTAVKVEAPQEEEAVAEQLSHLPIDQLQRGKYQPRREMDPEALEELANSIRAQGVIQPLVVRPAGSKFEIIAGERRWHAAQLAGLTEVPAIIRAIPDDAAVAIALIENIQRENLNPIEEAYALQRLIEEFGLTHQQAAEAVGKSRATISNLLRLMVLPEEIKQMLTLGELEMGHARALLTLPEHLQLEAAQMVSSKKLSVRETEQLVRQMQAEPTAKPEKFVSPEINDLQASLAKHLGLKVRIQCNASGKGKLVIHYRNLAELDRVLDQFEAD